MDIPFDKKGNYLLEIKYRLSWFSCSADFQLLNDADTTFMYGKSHLLSPHQQRYVDSKVKNVICVEGLELIKKIILWNSQMYKIGHKIKDDSRLQNQ